MIQKIKTFLKTWYDLNKYENTCPYVTQSEAHWPVFLNV